MLSFSPTILHAKELDFENFLDEAEPGINDITSNNQAQVFIQHIMGPFIPVPTEEQTRLGKPKGQPLPPLLTEKMATLGNEIAKWRFSSELEEQIDKERENFPAQSLPLSNAHLSWVKTNSPQTRFSRVVSLAETYFDLAKTPDSPLEELPHFATYAQWLYQTYPLWQKGPQGLLTVAEKEGAQGINKRLLEYWESKTSPEFDGPVPSEEPRNAYTAHYLHHHYLPYLQTYLRIALLKIQIESKNHAREIWSELRQWQINQKQTNGLMRLCGTWQWLIHNHQNHGDHKTVMVYPLPSQYDRLDPKPAQIHVQGDTVYIRWEFPRGIIQEESLLLSENDRALSGTFVNNMGPNGNITARRVKPCNKN